MGAGAKNKREREREEREGREKKKLVHEIARDQGFQQPKASRQAERNGVGS